jgi:hypothetical protein
MTLKIILSNNFAIYDGNFGAAKFAYNIRNTVSTPAT